MSNGESSYRRYLGGDESAFEELVTLYYDHLLLFINRYVKNTEDSEDIAVDCFAEIIAHPGRYRFKTSFKTYLFAIGRNKAVDFLRKNKNIRPMDEELPEEIAVSGEAGPFSALMENEEKAALYKAISSLSKDMQTAVHLIYFEELSFDETAKVMKKNKKQVYNLISRAKAELRSILSERGNEDA